MEKEIKFHGISTAINHVKVRIRFSQFKRVRLRGKIGFISRIVSYNIIINGGRGPPYTETAGV